VESIPRAGIASLHANSPNFLRFITSRLIAYFQLTKPSVMLLVLITGATTILIEGTLLAFPGKFALFLIGLFMTGGAANSLNQYFEREIDARMTRTRRRRPLPSGKISPHEALFFSITLGISGVIILGFYFNRMTGMLSLATILFYSFFYTLYLKPTSPYNIVIGGIAGAMAPVGAWMAVTGGTAIFPWMLFLIIFLWTPPHFWALALCLEDDYRAAGYPMLPLIRGNEATLKQIHYYLMALLLGSLTPILAGFGWLYFTISIILGVIFVGVARKAQKLMTHISYWRMFKFSIFYLFALFIALVIDKFL